MEVELLYFNHNCNCYLVSNNEECLLIDPGFNHDNALINAINKRSLKLKAVLLTHGHYDHIEGLKTLKNVPVYIFRDEEEALHNAHYNCSFMANNEFTVDDLDVHLIEEGDLELIRIKFKVIHTPFHTKGSVCYYLKDKGIVFTGDTLFFHAIGRYDLPTSAPRLVNESLKKLFLLPHSEDNDTTVYPGHGPKTTLSREYYFLKDEYLR